MEKETGDRILKEIRDRKGGILPRPYDREYRISNPIENYWLPEGSLGIPKGDPRKKKYERSAANIFVREICPGLSSKTYAKLAKKRARAAGAGSVCIGVVNDPLVSHHFCVVDYSPHKYHAESVQEMPNALCSKNALIIDPWMNISCNFHEYPAFIIKKLCKWSCNEKYIVRNGKLYDASLPFLQRILSGRLEFVSYWKRFGCSSDDEADNEEIEIFYQDFLASAF